MKKITLFTLLLFTSLAFSQTLSTGEITLEPGRTVQFDINIVTNIVTMTMTLPNNTWLGLGISSDIALGQGMGDLDDDAIIGLSTGIQDRNMPSGVGFPPTDTNDWTVTSNTVMGMGMSAVRTIVGTRARDTGSAEDFTFPNTEISFPMIYAKGGASFAQHDFGAYGMAMATLATLSTTEFATPAKFSIYPNPASNDFTLQLLNDSGSAKLEVFDILGKRVFTQELNDTINLISANSWSNGVYLIKVSNDKSVETKRFIKQ